MSLSPEVDFYPGCRPTTQGGTPSPLPPERSADALETIEFGQVSSWSPRARGRARWARRASARRRPTDDLALDRRRAGARGRGRRRSSAGATRCWPSRFPTCSARSAGSGSRAACSRASQLAALHRVLVAARLMHGRPPARGRRRRRSPARMARPLPDKAIERRLEQSVDADGSLLDTASPRLAAARREVHAARQRLLRKLETLLRGLDASTAPVRRARDRARRALRDPGAARLAQPAGRDHPRRERQRGHAVHRAGRGDRAGQRAPRGGGRTRSGKRSACCAS